MEISLYCPREFRVATFTKESHLNLISLNYVKIGINIWVKVHVSKPNDGKISCIEGMELNANKFSVIVTSIRKRPYDFLDQRKMEFDQDYDDFKRQIGELHVSSNIISS